MGKHSLEENNVNVDAELDAIINNTESNGDNELTESEKDEKSTSVDFSDPAEIEAELEIINDIQSANPDNNHVSDEEDEENVTSDETDDDSNDVLNES